MVNEPDAGGELGLGRELLSTRAEKGSVLRTVASAH